MIYPDYLIWVLLVRSDVLHKVILRYRPNYMIGIAVIICLEDNFKWMGFFLMQVPEHLLEPAIVW